MPFSDPKWPRIISMADKDATRQPGGYNPDWSRDRAHDISHAAAGLVSLQHGQDRPKGIERAKRNGGRKSKSNKKALSRRRKISKKSQTKKRK